MHDLSAWPINANASVLSQESEFHGRMKQMFELVFKQEEYKIKDGKEENLSSSKQHKATAALILCPFPSINRELQLIYSSPQ